MAFSSVQDDFLNIVLPAHVVTIFIAKAVNYFSASYFAANPVSLPIMDFFTGLIYLLPWTITVYLIVNFALENKTEWKWILSGTLVEISGKLFQVAFIGWSIAPSRITAVPLAFIGLILAQHAFLFGLVSQIIYSYQNK